MNTVISINWKIRDLIRKGKSFKDWHKEIFGVRASRKALREIEEKNKKIGELRSACYSPRFKKVVGIAMMYKLFWEKSQSFKIEINGDTFSGKVCDLPLI